ncbi:unnamed protein product [Orchesella dallaii]|uniref:CRAL-TRIO domain-containing protein n=1 Tax=Orchesella dallaii TaxID=48710 RepID=A0ABP1QWL8_9HEXA
MESLVSSISLTDSIVINDKNEEKALKKLKKLIEEYVIEKRLKTDTCQELICHLETIKVDNTLLLDYLRCRKNSVNDAWQTIKTYVESKFIHYSNVFRNENDEISEKARGLLRNHICGMLKNLDKHGRRIIYIDTSKWDINEFSMDHLAAAIIVGCESYWREPEVQKNGIVALTNSDGFSGAHARQFSFYKMMRMRNILKCFPISVKRCFYLKTHITMRISANLFKSLLPGKLASRIYIYSPNEKATQLNEIASPEILPDWMGGTLSVEEASVDVSYWETGINAMKIGYR